MTNGDNTARPVLIERLISAETRQGRSLISRLVQRRKEKHDKKAAEVRTWTRDEIVDAVRKARNNDGSLTRRRLKKLHNDDPSSFPSLSNIAVVMGMSATEAWHEITELAEVTKRTVRQTACVANIVGKEKKYGVLYFLELFSKFGLTNMTLYREARKKYPEVVPHVRVLYREIGGMRALKYLSRIGSCEKQLGSLVELMTRLNGRWPKKKTCREHGVDRTFLERKFGGRLELESLCRDIIASQTKKAVQGESR